MIIGSNGTTAHALAFCLMSIAFHPRVQQKLLAELGTAGLLPCATKQSPCDLQHEDLIRNLPYLGAVGPFTSCDP